LAVRRSSAAIAALRVVGGDRLTMPLDERYLAHHVGGGEQPTLFVDDDERGPGLLCTSRLKKRRKTTTGNVNRLAI